jgi:hypothetical protein
MHTRADGSTESLTETSRDDWSVYLKAGDGTERYIDLYQRQLRRRTDGALLFRIIDAS